MGAAPDISGGVSLPTRGEDVLALAHSDPAEACEQAQRLLAVAGDDASARSLALEALGVAEKERQRLDESLGHLREAVGVADDAGLRTRAARARMSLCMALVSRGEPEAALRECARAEGVLEGREAAHLRVRQALILQRLGQLDAALAAYDEVLPVLEATGDRDWQARLLTNRGVLHGYRRDFPAAERDLERAEALYHELGRTLAAAQVRHNLGFVAARKGDIPAALHSYDLAAATCRELDIVDWIGLADRCDLLLSARLLSEADELATRTVEQLARAGMESDLAEAQLTLANVKLLLGAPGAARECAEQARAAFSAQGREPWAALAQYVLLRAEWQAGQHTRDLFDRARRATVELDAAGWATAAVDAGLIAARTALELGDLQAAEHELVRHRAARQRGPVEVRARAWHAEALLRLARGNRGGADAALRAGMRALARHRATLGATELRAHISGHVDELARLGTRLAVDSGDPRRVLRWAERWRAGALFLRPVRPPDEEQLVRDLAELRATVAAVDQAALAGQDTRRLLRQQAALERAIQQRSRHARGLSDETLDTRALAAASERLGDRVLVEMVRVDDELYAVVVTPTRVRLAQLGSHRQAVEELHRLGFALRRLAVPRGKPAALTAARASADASASRLDRILLEPLQAHLDDRPLVIVPTGALHAVPWATLPSCVGRAVSVAPSLHHWYEAAGRRTAPAAHERVVLVGCTSPPHATGEVRALARLYPQAHTLVGEAAMVSAVTTAMDGAGLAHVACHGRFRSDNPLFSSLSLADGPLTVFDLERTGQAPRLLVLSACESGLSAVRPGDELMGLAATLFALGTTTLVASVVPVPDADTRNLMVAYHEQLQAGHGPAAALARAQTAGRSDGEGVAAAGFVCFGAG